ncbi:ASST-domain-containing protein [Rhexocercosporidium sp. MPI-PUGE-AT-0058]|nr:ASST-domain-containing protein [Rhexocercosporidium sp. MPI-PUGE-AT-0058]
MRSLQILATLPVTWVAAFSFNAWDLGFHGMYPTQHFQSVDFQPPAPKVTKSDPRCDKGNLFITPRGPLVNGAARGPVILDNKGEMIWMDNTKYEQAMNFNVQKYKGEDYLTFWTKTKKRTKKNGKVKKSKKSFVMLNSAYEVAYKITPQGHGLKGDSHEFRITPEGTALIAIYKKHEVDCTDLGLGKKCWIQDGWFQEIDIETNELLFEWKATDHISMKDVYSSPSMKDGHGKSKEDAFDFFHINSVDKTESGDYIVSARYMLAVICISGKTGELLWQLGGKNNNFKDLDHALNFAWQHHVTWQGNNTLSLFDNHANTVLHAPSKHSKGMIIHLDMEKMTASLVHKYVHPDKILNVSQGSVQIIPESGNVLVGFGNSPTYVEYGFDGEVLCAAHFAPHLLFELVDFGFVKSYRVFKHPWVGKPNTVPDVVVKDGTAYVSWNGATEVTGWRLQIASEMDAEDEEEFVTVKDVKRDGFETGIKLDKKHKYVRVVALDAKSGVLASSAIVKAPRKSSLSFLSIFAIMTVSALLSGTTAAFLIHRRRLPSTLSLTRLRIHFPRSLSDLKFRSHTGYKDVPVVDEDYDTEAAPLLLDERVVSP